MDSNYKANEFKVRDIMRQDPIKFKPDSDISEAISICVENDISGAVVVDSNQKPIGYLSEVDCIQSYISCKYNEQSSCGFVKDFMSSEIDALNPLDDYLTAARRFIDTRRRKFPVIDDYGNVVGSLDRHQLLAALDKIGW